MENIFFQEEKEREHQHKSGFSTGPAPLLWGLPARLTWYFGAGSSCMGHHVVENLLTQQTKLYEA